MKTAQDMMKTLFTIQNVPIKHAAFIKFLAV